MPGMPAAKEGDTVFAIDMHLIQPPGPTSPVVVPHPFTGTLDGELSSDVKIEGMAAATKGSTATNSPSHVPIRSEEHTSELQSLMRISYAVFCLKKKKVTNRHIHKQ